MFSKIDSETTFQGDIISEFEFLLPKVEIPKSVKTSEKTASLKTNAMIVTQTCDIQRRAFITVCPVYTFNDLKSKLSSGGKSDQRIQNFLVSVKKQSVNYYLYLPPSVFEELEVEESYVDLEVSNIVPLANIKNYLRIISLSDKGRHWLGYKLSNLFSRPY